MPEAISLVADEKEWAEFVAWQALPEPIMLDRDGKISSCAAGAG